MKPVRLNQPLVLEERTSAPDGAGGIQSDWQALGTLWAEVHGGAGRLTGGAAQVVSKTTYRIVVRAAPMGEAARPKPGQRFRTEARVWSIEAVREHDHAGRYLVCFATEEVGV